MTEIQQFLTWRRRNYQPGQLPGSALRSRLIGDHFFVLASGDCGLLLLEIEPGDTTLSRIPREGSSDASTRAIARKAALLPAYALRAGLLFAVLYTNVENHGSLLEFVSMKFSAPVP